MIRAWHGPPVASQVTEACPSNLILALSLIGAEHTNTSGLEVRMHRIGPATIPAAFFPNSAVAASFAL